MTSDISLCLANTERRGIVSILIFRKTANFALSLRKGLIMLGLWLSLSGAGCALPFSAQWLAVNGFPLPGGLGMVNHH
jgi:hypothetical protein